MNKISWSAEARKNLKDIIRFIRLDSPQNAAFIGKVIYKSVGRLALFSLSGRMVPEYNDYDVREVVVQGFRIIYVYEGKEVKIVAIFHSRQLVRETTKVKESAMVYEGHLFW